jgi:surface protein
MSYLPEFVAIYEIEPYIITALDDNTIREALISYFEHQDAFYSKEDIISIYGKIENWDTSRVTDMSKLFWIPRTDCYCAFWIFEPEIYHDLNLCYEFNEDISKWDVSNVENMTEMFMDCKKFNTPIGDWDVSKVKDMSGMFFMAENFNQSLSNWNVSNVKSMSSMFKDACSFSKPIGDWDVSNVKDMNGMFYNDFSFGEDLNNWKVSPDTDTTEMFDTIYTDEDEDDNEAVHFNFELAKWYKRD